MSEDKMVRFGWTSLLVWAACGAVLETLHALKVAAYLDDEMTRWLCTLGHAHGVGLSLVVLLYASVGVPLFRERPAALARVGSCFAVAAVLMPLGFVAGAVAHPEGDPSLGIILVPLGAAFLFVALGRVVLAAWRGGRGSTS